MDPAAQPGQGLETRRHDDVDDASSADEPSISVNLATAINSVHLQNMRKVGGGGFGTVYAIHHITLGDLALKRLNENGLDNAEQRRRATREAELWKGLKHPHVLGFIGVLELSDSFYFVCPYQKNGSLDRFLRNNPDLNRLALIVQCADALAYLHGEGIIHGDIKAANVLISDDKQALLCDFGLSRWLDVATSTTVQGAGSIRWMSPELLVAGKGKTFSSDIWALGMLIYEVLSGKLPYHDKVIPALVLRAIALDNELPAMEPVGTADGTSYRPIWDIVAACWKADPKKRPLIDQVYAQLQAVLAVNAHPRLAPLKTRNNVRVSTSWRENLLRMFRSRPREREVTIIGNHPAGIMAVAFSPDSRTLASGSAEDQAVRLYDVLEAMQLGESMRQHDGPVSGVAFSPDGATLVSASYDEVALLWNVENGKSRRALVGHQNSVTSVAIAGDDSQVVVATGSTDWTVGIWDFKTGNSIAELRGGHGDKVECLAITPNGKTVASGSSDHTVRLWDLGTSSQRGESLEHPNGVSSVAFSPDGLIFASGCADNSVYLWSANTGERHGPPLTGHTDAVRGVAFSPDGRLLASASDDRTIRLWDFAETSPMQGRVLDGHDAAVTCVCFSPDGKWLASGSIDKTIRLWDLHVLMAEKVSGLFPVMFPL